MQQYIDKAKQLFGYKGNDVPTQDELVKVAERYFREHLKGLTSGGVRVKVGNLNLNLSCVVDEGKTQS
jgi:hypothetical protein